MDERDVSMIKDPNMWPRWPALPMKKLLGRQIKCGYIIDDGKKPDIIIGSIFDIPRDPILLKALPREEYDSAEEVSADGWRVD